MKIKMKHKKSKKFIDLIGNPIKFSTSKVKYKKSPPTLGQDTEKILTKFLKLSKNEVNRLKDKKIIEINLQNKNEHILLCEKLAEIEEQIKPPTYLVQNKEFPFFDTTHSKETHNTISLINLIY